MGWMNVFRIDRDNPVVEDVWWTDSRLGHTRGPECLCHPLVTTSPEWGRQVVRHVPFV